MISIKSRLTHISLPLQGSGILLFVSVWLYVCLEYLACKGRLVEKFSHRDTNSDLIAPLGLLK